MIFGKTHLYRVGGMHPIASILILIAGLLCFPDAAQAYIDPGAGSILLQGVLGAVALGVTVVAAFWRNVRRVLTRFARTDQPGDE